MNKLDRILNYVIDEMEPYGGKVYLYDNEKAYNCGKPYSTGYFIYPEIDGRIKIPQIHIGWKNDPKVLIGILLHEFCHFKQYINKTSVWKKHFKNKKCGHIADAQMELECERMVIQLIRRKFKDLVNLKEYIKAANAYIQFYLVYQLTDRFCDKAPYKIKSIRDKMPTKLIRKIDKNSTLSPDLVKEYVKCYR